MEARSKIYIFIDEEIQPIAELVAPVNFELDTTKLIDGKHILKIVSKDPTGKEGIRLVPFEVRNGPAIAIEGIKENAVVDGIIPIMVNAYGKGDQKNFMIIGSETPQSIPFWIFVLLILFVAWAAYYHFTSSAIQLYTK
ncbi:MAG: cytochrome C [Pedobacter sp.]|nr:cytochrome C [Pedobacter sp.]